MRAQPAIGIRALINAPVVEQGRLAALFCVGVYGVLSRREGQSTLGMDSSRDRGEDLRVDNTTTLPAAQDGRNKAIPF